MAEQINSSESILRTEFFNELLTRRRPDASDPEHILALLAAEHGAEVVVRIVDAIEGFDTPDPTAEQLGMLSIIKFWGKLMKAGLSSSSEIQ